MTQSTAVAPIKEPTYDELKARVLELENAKASHGIKVSAKGAISVYGLGRMPVTLYESQWVEFFRSKAAPLLDFLAANKANSLIARKPAGDATPKAARIAQYEMLRDAI